MDFITLLAALGQACIALFIIVDPFGNIPIFVGLTETMEEKQRRKTFNVATLVSIVLLVVFAFTGQELLNIFGLSIYSFEVAGGILLLIIAIRILISGSMHEHIESPESIGAVPIAMPLLVGPGAITTTMFTIQTYHPPQYEWYVGYTVAVLAAVIVLSITWVILRYMNGIYRFLGKTGALVIARVMALFIAAIAIQYILTGVTHFVT